MLNVHLPSKKRISTFITIFGILLLGLNPHIAYAEGIEAVVTKYTKIETCPKRVCITAMGTVATRNRTVACPRAYKLGTKIIIDGNSYICEDRTAKKYDGRFDVYEGDERKAYNRAISWGKQNKTIIIK